MLHVDLTNGSVQAEKQLSGLQQAHTWLQLDTRNAKEGPVKT